MVQPGVPPTLESTTLARLAAPSPPPAPLLRPRSSSTLEPLSPGRFKVAFTADADLKRKLELARDLLRHAVPPGALATIVGRALDVLKKNRTAPLRQDQASNHARRRNHA